MAPRGRSFLSRGDGVTHLEDGRRYFSHSVTPVLTDRVVVQGRGEVSNIPAVMDVYLFIYLSLLGVCMCACMCLRKLFTVLL